MLPHAAASRANHRPPRQARGGQRLTARTSQAGLHEPGRPKGPVSSSSRANPKFDSNGPRWLVPAAGRGRGRGRVLVAGRSWTWRPWSRTRTSGTRDGCLTGSADVSTCWQSSSGSRAASTALSCSNAPHSQRVRRLASLWCGSTGNRWPQSRPTSARNPASLRRPSRCRTSAIASSSASVQAGEGPRAVRDPDRPGKDQVVDQHVDVDEQVFSWQHKGRPLRMSDVDTHLSSAEAAPCSSRHARINPHNAPKVCVGDG